MEDLSAEIAGIRELSSAAGDVELLKRKLKEADGFIKQENIKSAVPRIEEAKEIINNRLVAAQKAVVEIKITAVKTGVSAMKTPAAKEQFAQEIEKADVLLNESEELYQKGKYIESYKCSEKVNAILAAVIKAAAENKSVAAADKKPGPERRHG